MKQHKADVVIVGGGPSGLAAAIQLKRRGVDDVVVLEREGSAGGVPRHCYHTGFGLRDMRRLLTGPAYARRYVGLANSAGVEIRTLTAVTEWQDERTLRATSPAGRSDFSAKAIILATGCRERPRPARLIPGTRPAGIFTTGALQQSVYLHHLPIGKRAVVIGAEHVSFSALMTLRHAGVEVAAMITEQPQHQSFWFYKFITANRWSIPLLTHASLTNILGRDRVEAVEITDQRSQQSKLIECDTIIFTGDWIPDHELARLGNISLDSQTSGPQVDAQFGTSKPGVFAVGNLVHPAEIADHAALSGRHVVRAVLRCLEGRPWHDAPLIPIQAEYPIRSISPQLIEWGTQPQYLSLRMDSTLFDVTLQIWQGEQCLWQRRYRELCPNLPVHISSQTLARLEPEGKISVCAVTSS